MFGQVTSLIFPPGFFVREVFFVRVSVTVNKLPLGSIRTEEKTKILDL